MKTLLQGFVSLVFFSFPYFIQDIACLTDTLTTTQAIKDGETIISSGGSFELGFFSPRNTKNRYVGIWYKKVSVQTVVWVANRKVPLINTSGTLEITKPGCLVLRNDANNIIWSANSSMPAGNPIAQLLDSGNLVVRDANDGNPDMYLWQSFDFPTDTLLPGMKLGWNFLTGFEVYLSSWKNDEDPAPGEFTGHCDPAGYPQLVLNRGSALVYRTGPWNGLRFSGTHVSKNPIFSFGLHLNKNEVYYRYELLNKSIVTRYTVTYNGAGQRWTWIDRTKSWTLYLTSPTDNCDNYASCGAYGSCSVANSPICICLDKFVPKYLDEWIKADWTNGCQRRKPLDCHSGDGFLKYSGLKLPDTRRSWFSTSMSLEECKTLCLKNCSCTAYSSLDIRNGGSGCLLWFGDLIDMKVLSEDGQDIYIRMASSESDSTVSTNRSHAKKKEILVISLSISVGVVLVGLSLILYLQRRDKKYPMPKLEGMLQMDDKHYNSENHKKDLDLSTFDLFTIMKATDNFSINNKLGQGGFGPVYKGILQNGLEVAVKRLSKTSMQGLEEFKNEVICIAKLQHRNLVKLLGWCIEGVERILIYEYMPNKSLDSFIFDKTSSTLLDWNMRFHIIQGVARGLLYLHQDSRLRIIHRDLKAGNILLDNEMNPKISDFGMARTFGGNETGANTSHVVGTHGYMSPEYAVDGVFSVKSDVFSFGVLVLETVSGKRNRGFSHQEHQLNLLGHAWRLYKEERALELLDAHLGDSYNSFEVLQSIHIGLLCVQHCPEDRPSMSVVVSMFSNEGLLPEAKQPGFYLERNTLEAEFSSSSQGFCSRNEITITLLDAR